MSEHDYEAIEAAVTETVRGRWFLSEFARRNRQGELGQILDAVHRLETTVASGHAALSVPQPADPSVRLLMQRIKDISGQLEALSREMGEAGADLRFVDAVEQQARAVAGMLRGGSVGASSSKPRMPRVEPMHVGSTHPSTALPGASAATEAPPASEALPAHVDHAYRSAVQPQAEGTPLARLPRAELPEALLVSQPASVSQELGMPDPFDPRRAVLAEIDSLSLSEKLALFA